MNSPILNDVSDTALWVAVYRARESKRPAPLFRDPLAEKLAGDRGLLIEQKMSNSRYVEWSVIIRTHIIDGFIKTLLGEGIDMVINLGAGLDTRPYRLDLPKNLRWVEIDFPKIIELKNSKLGKEQPRCQLERISLDLSKEADRRQVFARLNSESQNALVITEGVTPYLSNAAVASLAQELRRQPHFRHFITDYNSPELFKFLDHPKRRKEMQNAPFLFNPPDWKSFYEQQGWKVRDLKYIGEVSEEIGRPAPHPLWIKIVTKLFAPKEKIASYRRMNGYALLEPTSSVS